MRNQAHRKVKTVFENINATRYSHRDDDRYLRVWDTFGRAPQDEKKKPREKLKSVVDQLLTKFHHEFGPGIPKGKF
jgi:hypothetical protein